MLFVANLFIGICFGTKEEEDDTEGIDIVLDEGELLAGDRFGGSVFGSSEARLFGRVRIYNIIIFLIF